MRNLLGSLLPFLFLFLVSLHNGDDYINFQWFGFFICVAVSFLPGLSLATPLSTAIGLFLSYAVAHCAYIFAFKQNMFAGSPSEALVVISYYAAYQLLCLLGAALIFSLTGKKTKEFSSAFGYYCLCNSVYVLIGFIAGFGKLKWGIGYSGFLDYASVNGCLIAATFPFVLTLFKNKRLLFAASLLPLAAVFASKSSVPVGGLMVAYLALVFSYCRDNLRAFILPVILMAGVFLVGSSFLDKNLFDSGYRFEAYKLFMGFWFNKAPMLTGFGPGTFVVLAPQVQLETNYMITGTTGSFWLFLHSEWLQLLFEYGVIGLLLCLVIFYLTCLIFYRNRRHEMLAAFLSLSASNLFNFNLRYAAGSLLLGFLLYAAIQLESDPAI